MHSLGSTVVVAPVGLAVVEEVAATPEAAERSQIVGHMNSIEPHHYCTLVGQLVLPGPQQMACAVWYGLAQYYLEGVSFLNLQCPFVKEIVVCAVPQLS